jgi:hypothetical protein
MATEALRMLADAYARQSLPPALRHLDVAANPLGAGAAAPLVELLTRCPLLDTVNVSEALLAVAELGATTAVVAAASVRTLDVSGAMWTTDSLAQLLRHPALARVHTLRLNRSTLTGGWGAALGHLASCRLYALRRALTPTRHTPWSCMLTRVSDRLSELSIAGTSLGTAGLEALAVAVAHLPALRRVDMARCDGSAAAFARVVSALGRASSQPLDSLCIAGNRLGGPHPDAGAGAAPCRHVPFSPPRPSLTKHGYPQSWSWRRWRGWGRYATSTRERAAGRLNVWPPPSPRCAAAS